MAYVVMANYLSTVFAFEQKAETSIDEALPLWIKLGLYTVLLMQACFVPLALWPIFTMIFLSERMAQLRDILGCGMKDKGKPAKWAVHFQHGELFHP